VSCCSNTASSGCCPRESTMASVLFAGTTRGLAAVNMLEGSVHKLGLDNCYINHVSKLKNTLAAACPEFGPLHSLPAVDPVSYATHPNHQPGLHLLDLPASPAQYAGTPSARAWTGDARSCRLVPGSAPSAPPRIFVGTEPADVLVSEDLGSTWADTASFGAIPTRPNWYFPPPPHQPHVLSIDPAELSDGTPAWIAGESLLVAACPVVVGCTESCCAVPVPLHAHPRCLQAILMNCRGSTVKKPLACPLCSPQLACNCQASSKAPGTYHVSRVWWGSSARSAWWHRCGHVHGNWMWPWSSF
jgi:hypothetical protein